MVRGILILMALGIVVLGGGSPALGMPQREDRIAYEFGRAEEDNLALYTARLNGSDRVRLSPAYFSFDGQPVYSPDGDRIALHSVKNFDRPQIWVINIDGTGLTRVTNDEFRDASPSWSPDATRLAYDSQRPGRNRDIYSINLDGTDETRLTTDAARDEFPAWSPDGTKIAFQSDRDGDWEIYVMDVDGSGVEQLTDNSRDDIKPDWSPSGEYLAFAGSSGNGLDVFVIAADGSEETRLTTADGDDSDPDWSPDGSKIAFSSRREGQADIWMMDPDGDAQERLFGQAPDEDYPDWAPRGCTVASVEDGDTFACTDGTTVDMLQIDAPELGDCGGEWAAAALGNIFLTPGRRIALSFDHTTEDGNVLAAPIVRGTDGVAYNLSIIMAYVGLAKASRVGSGNTKYMRWASDSQGWASSAQWNMWAPGKPFNGGC